MQGSIFSIMTCGSVIRSRMGNSPACRGTDDDEEEDDDEVLLIRLMMHGEGHMARGLLVPGFFPLPGRVFPDQRNGSLCVTLNPKPLNPKP